MIEKIARRVIEKLAFDRGTTGTDDNRDFSNIIGRGLIAPAAAIGGAAYGLHHALPGAVQMLAEGSDQVGRKLDQIQERDVQAFQQLLSEGPEGARAAAEKIAPHVNELRNKLLSPGNISRGLGLAALPIVGGGLSGYLGWKYAPKAIDAVLDKIVGPREQN